MTPTPKSKEELEHYRCSISRASQDKWCCVCVPHANCEFYTVLNEMLENLMPINWLENRVGRYQKKQHERFEKLETVKAELLSYIDRTVAERVLAELKPLLPEMYVDEYGDWVRTKIADRLAELRAAVQTREGSTTKGQA